jgi:hypothetical protein
MGRFRYITKFFLVITTITLIFAQTNVYAAPTLSSIKINEQLPAYGSIKLTVTGTYSDGTSSVINTGIVWESSNTSIAIVDGGGNVALVGHGGTVTITATCEGKSNSISVATQNAPAASSYITIEGLPNICEKGLIYTLVVQTVFSDLSEEIISNKYITFTSSDTNIAAVNAEGIVSVHGEVGAFMITATYRDKTARLVSYVNSAGWVQPQYTSGGGILDIKILGDMPKDPFLPIKLVAKGEYSDGNFRDLPSIIYWTTSDSEVVSITKDGIISFGGKYGQATITARYDKYEDSVTINIDNSKQVYEAVQKANVEEALVYNKQKSYFNDSIVDTSNIAKTLEQLDIVYQSTNMQIFKDIKNHWSEKEINAAAKLGIISGYADNTFKPDIKISRAEFAAIIYKAFSVRYYIDDPGKTFKDVKGMWHQDYVMALKNSGIINGYVDGTFKPNNYITRGEMIAIISRLIVKEDIATKDFNEKYSDISDSYWAKGDIDKLYSIGALEMIGKSKLEPNKSATRAEVVNIIVRLLMNIDKNSK